MSRPLPRALHRIAAVGLLLAAVGAVAAAVALPVVAVNRSYDETVETLQFRYEKLRRLAAVAAPLQRQLRILRAQGPRPEDLLVGDSEALAGAQLQEIVKQYIRRAGGTLESTHMLPTAKDEFFERITVRVRMTAPISALQQTLHAIESSRPLLFVDNVDITTKQSRQAQKDRSQPVRLSVSFDMNGYRRAKAM